MVVQPNGPGLLVENVVVVEVAVLPGAVVVPGLYRVERLLHALLEAANTADTADSARVVDVVEVEGGGNELLQVERIIFVETDRTEVCSDVEESAGGIRNRNRQLENAGGVAVQSVEVRRLGKVLVVMFLSGVRLERDLFQSLQWRQIRII